MKISNTLFSYELRKNIVCDVLSENTLCLRFVIQDKTNIEYTKTNEQLPILIAKLRHYFIHKNNHLNTTITDSIPSYDTLLLTCDIAVISINDLKNKIKKALDEFFSSEDSSNIFQNSENNNPNHIIPVYYGKEVALDLERMSLEKNMDAHDIIKEHTLKTYTVCAIGFSPGFAYLGFLNETICHKRLENPRKYVSAGSVGIADNQTGIYPSDSPGGWNIIGRTPFAMIKKQFDKNPNLFKVGDCIQFSSISKETYVSLGGKLF